MRDRILPESDTRVVDPFSIDLPDERFDEAYVLRKQVIEEIEQPGFRVIVGPSGSGKSTLLTALVRNPPDSVLRVELNLNRVGTLATEQDIFDGKYSFFTPEFLSQHVFNAYWEANIYKASRRDEFLQHLRVDREWMELLRWFHRRFRPLHSIVSDFQLMAWLSAPPRDEDLLSRVSSPQILQELVSFVTWEPPKSEYYGQEPPAQRCKRIDLLVGGTDQFSKEALKRLIRDAQRLIDMRLGENVEFKIFLDQDFESSVLSMPCARQGRVAVIQLPGFSKQELQDLLRKRVYSARIDPMTRSELTPVSESGLRIYSLQGDADDYEFVSADHSLDRILPLSRGMKGRLESLIVQGAEGSPFHALRLAQCAVAACAGCFPDCTPPLDEDVTTRLIALYKQSKGMMQNAGNKEW